MRNEGAKYWVKHKVIFITIRGGCSFLDPFWTFSAVTPYSSKYKNRKKKYFFAANHSAPEKTKLHKKLSKWTEICAVDTLLAVTFEEKKIKIFFQKFVQIFFVKLSFSIITKNFFIISFFILLEAYYVNFSFKSSSFCGS